MSKTKKKSSRSGKPGNLERRPWEFFALLVLVGVNILGGAIGLYMLHVATTNALANGTVSPATMRAFGQYHTAYLLVVLGLVVLGIFLLFNNKVSYWIWAVLSIGATVYGVTKLNLNSILIKAITLYVTFCEPTRRWFRIGKFKTLPPRPKRKKKPQ